MNHQQKDAICMIKHHAYRKGYMDGYRHGIADSKNSLENPQIASNLLAQPIQFLNLSTRPFNCLDRSGFRTIGDIVPLSKEDIWRIRGLGSKGMQEIAQALWNYGIRQSNWNV